MIYVHFIKLSFEFVLENTDINKSKHVEHDNKSFEQQFDQQHNKDCRRKQIQHSDSSSEEPAMNWNMLRKCVIGLRNMDSSTCYIKAALQCLASTPPLTQWIFKQIDKLHVCE